MERHKRWRRENPEKSVAEQKFDYLIKKGVIKRKDCVVCGKPDSLAHHPDYSKPYQIIWLCKKHHTAVHHKYNPLKIGSNFIENHESHTLDFNKTRSFIKNGKQYRWCRKCDVVKPINLYPKDPKRLLKHGYVCLQCWRKSYKDYYERKKTDAWSYKC